MGDASIVKKFLAAGYQLSQEALAFFQQEPAKVEEFLVKFATLSPKPVVITGEVLKQITTPSPVPVIPEVAVETVLDGGRKPKSVQEVTTYLAERYKKISGWLAEKPELVNLLSIRKITEKTTQFSLIGLVREQDGESLVVEDLTGETTVYLDLAGEPPATAVVSDEVVGLVCRNEQGRITAESIVRPDIPLKKQIARTTEDLFCYVISDLEMDAEVFDEKRYRQLVETVKGEQGKHFVFLLGGLSRQRKDVERLLDELPAAGQKVYLHPPEEEHLHRPDVLEFVRPVILNISGIKILLAMREDFQPYLPPEKTPAAAFLDLVKKRHLNPTFLSRKLVYDSDPYLLENMPDLFCLGQCRQPEVINHKGATIVTAGRLSDQPVFWKINLKTRENLKIDLT